MFFFIKLIEGLASGGGIYFEYNRFATPIKPITAATTSSIPTTNASLKTTILISNSQFINNKGDTVSIHPTGSGIDEAHIGFGRGGAVALFILDSEISDNLELTIRDCIFHSNTAAWGGAVYTRFRYESSNNIVIIRDSNFTENNANFSGGAFFVTTTQLEDYNNTMHLDGCWFDGNQAKMGGGISYKSIAPIGVIKRSRNTIRGTNFTQNKANVIFFQKLFAYINYE